MIHDNPLAKGKWGGIGGGNIGYELQYQGFFVGLGVGFDYMQTSLNYDGVWVDMFNRLDKEAESHIYSYSYSAYQETNTTYMLTLPIYLGYNVGEYFYAKAGITFELPLAATYQSSVTMETYGEYERFIETFYDMPRYGFYTPDVYSFSGSVETGKLPRAAFGLELGSNIPLSTRKVRMRIGVYGEYDIPLSTTSYLSWVDYSKVDINPLTQNKENLRANLHLNSYLDTNHCNKIYQGLSLGVRFTLLFDVTKSRYDCRCIND